MKIKPLLLNIIASLGLLIIAFFIMDYKDLSWDNNKNAYIIISLCFIMWMLFFIIKPMKNKTSSLIFINLVIIAMVLIFIFNIIAIIINPKNYSCYGWIFASFCFLMGFRILRKDTLHDIRRNNKVL